MDTSVHNLSTLFEQLGLASDAASIERFIIMHKPLASEVPLAKAEFWSSGQSAFLQESIGEDSDWAEQVDQLDALLRYSDKTH